MVLKLIIAQPNWIVPNVAECYPIQLNAIRSDLIPVLDRDVENLSGGELQRFAIAVVAAQQADVYMWVVLPTFTLSYMTLGMLSLVRTLLFFSFHISYISYTAY